MKRISSYTLILFVILLFTNCKKELFTEKLDPSSLLAGRLSGTWAKPTNIVTPEGVPPEVFGNMRLVFTVDKSGNPSEFLAQDCPIIFNNEKSNWNVSGTEDHIQLGLTEVSPVDELEVNVIKNTISLNFFMGWENTETGEKGKGDFKVTLTRL